MVTLAGETVREAVVALRAEVAVVTRVVGLAGTLAVDRLTVVAVRTAKVTVTGTTFRVAEITVGAGVAVRGGVLFAALAFSGRLGAVSGRVKVIAIAG